MVSLKVSVTFNMDDFVRYYENMCWVFEHRCMYRFDETFQVLHFKLVWVHVVEVFKVFEQSTVVHFLCCGRDNGVKFTIADRLTIISNQTKSF